MTMARPEDKTLGYLYDRFIGDDPEQIACYERARADSQVAGAIYDLQPRPVFPSATRRERRDHGLRHLPA